MHTKLNKNLYKVNLRHGCPPAAQAVSHLREEVVYVDRMSERVLTGQCTESTIMANDSIHPRGRWFE